MKKTIEATATSLVTLGENYLKKYSGPSLFSAHENQSAATKLISLEMANAIYFDKKNSST